MKLKFLGSGTSQGIPVIGCECKVCRSNYPEDKRLRSSVMITTENQKKILIDCGPDFRTQMIGQNEKNVDAILVTHEHNDHIIGLDDVRPLIFRQKKEMPIYCEERVAAEIKNRFPYAFAEKKYPGAPSFDLNIIESDFSLFDCDIFPIRIMHHELPIFGYRFKDLAYITDASLIPHEEKQKLKNLDVLILNCIRKTDPHPAHFILPQIFQLFEELKPKKLYLTHISHHFGLHKEENKILPKEIQLAYDGLEIDF